MNNVNNVSAFGSVTILKNGVSLSVGLVSTKPLQQVFTGEKVAKDWTVAENQSIVYPFVLASNSTAPVTNLSNPVWVFGGTTLTFDASGNCTNTGLTGMFAKTTYNLGSTPVPALKITGNVMKLFSTHQKLVLLIDATVDGHTSNVTDNTDVTRFDNPGDAYVGTIEFTNGGVLTPESPQTTLTADLTLGGNPVTAGVAYVWEKWNGTAWAAIGKTTKSITVGVDDVDGQARYRVAFKISNSIVTHAYFVVRDLSDPLEIVIDQATQAQIGISESLVITGKVQRVGTTNVIPGFTFNYTLEKLDGTVITSGVATGGKFTITGQQVVDAGGTLNWSLTASK